MAGGMRRQQAARRPAGNTAPDQFLFQRATDAVMRQRWLDARK